MKTIIEMAREAAGLAGPALVENIEITEWLERFTTLVKAAHTAELLEGVEMPEPHKLFTERCGHVVFTADQLRETVAAAVLRKDADLQIQQKQTQHFHDLFHFTVAERDALRAENEKLREACNKFSEAEMLMKGQP